MTRVLLIGVEPKAMDFSDPDLPPGSTLERISAGIDASVAAMRARGWDAFFCGILPDNTAEVTIATALAECWDCIVVGGGIRIPSRGLELFERVINAVHVHAPATPIAFNTSPGDTADAASRWLTVS